MGSARDRGTQMRKVGKITLCRYDHIKTRVFGDKIRYDIWVGKRPRFPSPPVFLGVRPAILGGPQGRAEDGLGVNHTLGYGSRGVVHLRTPAEEEALRLWGGGEVSSLAFPLRKHAIWPTPESVRVRSAASCPPPQSVAEAPSKPGIWRHRDVLGGQGLGGCWQEELGPRPSPPQAPSPPGPSRAVSLFPGSHDVRICAYLRVLMGLSD